MGKPLYQERIGAYITTSTAGESFRAYIPPSLPPEPKLELEGLYPLMEKANQALGRLDGLGALLPDIWLFIYFYVRKEAVFSSQIEGTQSSLADLLMYESQEKPGVPLDDVQEVSNYVAALNHGLARMREGFPLSLRLIREMHAVLLSKGRGSKKSPGEFRTSQNWIGGTRPGNASFVPPPADKVMDCLSDLEKFLHGQPQPTSPLLKAALSHVQFETSHPFLDGHGRLGRLLITLILCSEGVLSEPVLYLSLYFKTHRQDYYALLQKVREDGDWESWLEFFFTGIIETSQQGIETAKEILTLREHDQARIRQLKRASSSALSIHQHLQKNPIVTIQHLTQVLNLSAPSVTNAITHLESLGIVRELTGKQRGRVFVYDEYLKILQQGTDQPFA